MIGMMAVNLAMGIGKGLMGYSQGKSFERTGKRIRAEYQKLGKNKEKYKEMADNQKKTAKELQKNQHKQAEIQYDWNKNEVRRALETNLRGILSQYSSAREDLKNSIYEARANLSFKNDIKNVEESSIKIDSQNRLEAEANLNSQVIIENQLNDTKEIENQAIAQYYQSGLGYNRSIEGVNQNYLSSLSSAEMQLIRDNSQLQSFINQGVASGQNFINKGMHKKVLAGQQITSSVLDFGIGAFKQYGGNTALGKFLGMSGGDNGLKEIEGTYGKTGLDVPVRRISEDIIPMGQALTKFKGGWTL